MTVEHNGFKYNATLESVFFDFSIKVVGLEDACAIIREMEKMDRYKFGEIEHTDMVVTKRTIVMDANGVTARIVLREKTEAEKVREELEALKADISTLVKTSSKSDAAKFTSILEKAGIKSVEEK